MALQASVRRWHRRLSLLIGLQLLAWTVSGLVFTWVPIAEVRGEHVLRDPLPAGPIPDLSELPRADALPGDGPVHELRLAPRGDVWVWWLSRGDEVALYDASTGAALAELTPHEVRELIRPRLAVDARFVSTEHITAASGEYRDKPLPAWCLRLDDDEHTAIYVDALTGDVGAVRTDTWRRFDWFWMLHIMDYDERTDFGTPLLTGAALLGVLSASSGLVLGLSLLVRRRRAASAA